MHVLRAEKGFIIVGQDTDGSMTPDDLNMGWCVGRTKPFSWIGWRGMNREDCVREERKQLVGLCRSIRMCGCRKARSWCSIRSRRSR